MAGYMNFIQARLNSYLIFVFRISFHFDFIFLRQPPGVVKRRCTLISVTLQNFSRSIKILIHITLIPVTFAKIKLEKIKIGGGLYLFATELVN